jgi:hypothetical protein
MRCYYRGQSYSGVRGIIVAHLCWLADFPLLLRAVPYIILIVAIIGLLIWAASLQYGGIKLGDPG